MVLLLKSRCHITPLLGEFFLSIFNIDLRITTVKMNLITNELLDSTVFILYKNAQKDISIIFKKKISQPDCSSSLFI